MNTSSFTHPQGDMTKNPTKRYLMLWLINIWRDSSEVNWAVTTSAGRAPGQNCVNLAEEERWFCSTRDLLHGYYTGGTQTCCMRRCESSTDSIYCLFKLNTGCFKCLLSFPDIATRMFLIHDSGTEFIQHMFKFVIIQLWVTSVHLRN